ncbi:hypothetical protein ACFPT7_02700 [Acidicapsa dinghuensis]|uniref:Uncharacterized protein n=1 Tax=Acidicapsa dinghuensis TaxID=2218256 RepID=A0ABW1EBC2_9BACT|nr:hypothetical protein [Acidicapsa dinghuensis]
MAGTRHLGTTEGRFRTLGGSSTRWGGQLLPYTDEVFQPPAGLLSERWPITSADIGGYYQEIQDIFGVGSLPFTEALLTALGHSPSPFSSDIRVRYSKWRRSRNAGLAQSPSDASSTPS